MFRRSRRALSAGLAALLVLIAPACAPGLSGDASRYTWTSEVPEIGGLSGLEVSDDGLRFAALGDRGLFIEGRLVRENGRIVSVALDRSVELSGPDGAALPRHRRDAEGLARRADGRLFVSLEGAHRVAALDPDGRLTDLPRAPEFAALEPNAGLEALAIDAQGRLLAVPERSGAANRAFPVWRFDGQGWSVAARLPRRGGFHAVGADVGPDGMFYLLERGFTGLGFRSRVRRFDLAAGADLAEETLLETATGVHDNLEGISVWRDKADGIVLTMVSDDNHMFFQRTEFVEYRLER